MLNVFSGVYSTTNSQDTVHIVHVRITCCYRQLHFVHINHCRCQWGQWMPLFIWEFWGITNIKNTNTKWALNRPATVFLDLIYLKYKSENILYFLFYCQQIIITLPQTLIFLVKFFASSLLHKSKMLMLIITSLDQQIWINLPVETVPNKCTIICFGSNHVCCQSF